jgi:hypothetical protein
MQATTVLGNIRRKNSVSFKIRSTKGRPTCTHNIITALGGEVCVFMLKCTTLSTVDGASTRGTTISGLAAAHAQRERC